MIRQTSSSACDNRDCVLCNEGFYCGQKHNVYKLTCKNCPDDNSSYIGASRRPSFKRLKEHEASVRRYNPRTTMGQHMIAAHPELKPETIVNRVNFTDFLLNVSPEIVCRGKDTLETFIREGIYIRNEKPALNNINNNGFIFI